MKFCKLNPNLAGKIDRVDRRRLLQEKYEGSDCGEDDSDDPTKDYPWNEGCADVNQNAEHCTDVQAAVSEEQKKREEEERALQRTIETLAINLCVLEKKSGKKSVEEIINTIRRDDFNKEAFLKRVRHLDDCKEICRDIVSKSLAEMNFEERTVHTADRKFSSKIYVRNVIDVLRKQMKQADLENFYTHSVTKQTNAGQNGFHHFLETEFARKLEEEVCDRVKKHSNVDVMWMTSQECGRESFVGFLQLYSDKSKTSLKRTGVTAYPIHVTLMNFCYPAWKKEIMEERTLAAYLPVGVDYEDDIWRMSDISNPKTSIPRVVKLELLQKAMEEILSPLNSASQSGFPCRNRVGMALQCHPIIAEIAADCPEQKDLACLMHGCQTRRPCCRCECEKENLSDGNLYNPRSGSETIERRKTADQIGKQLAFAITQKDQGRAKMLRDRKLRILRNMSISACRSYFESTSLLLNNTEHDVYKVFGFEPLHVFDLGISKELKKCLFRRLGSEKLVMKGSERNGRTYKTCRTAILRACNEMLKRNQVQGQVPGIVVDFSSNDSSNALNGLFTSDGICGMLEAKNYRHVDYVFPFLASFVDRICGEKECMTTAISVIYIDLVNWVLERPDNMLWTESELKKLDEFVHSFQELIVNQYGKYQPSQFCTEKFHALSHLGDDIRKYGDLRMLDVGIYENRHVTFKEEYGRTSKRSDNALKEGVQRIDSRNVLGELIRSRSLRSEPSEHSSAIVVPKENWSGLTTRTHGETVLISEFEHLLKYVSEEMANHEDSIPKDVLQKCNSRYGTGTVNLFRKTGDQAGQALVSLLREGNVNGVKVRCSNRIVVVKSGVVDGGYYCSKDCIGEHSMKIEKILRCNRSKQRVIATEKYSHGGQERFSFALIRGTTVEGEFTYHVVQVRALFHCELYGRRREMAFVKYMDVVKSLDKAEDMLGCLCLRWSTDDDVDYTNGKQSLNMRKPPAPWYDVVDFNSVQSVVHVVRQRYELVEDTHRKHWATHRYCLNRFIKFGKVIDVENQNG